MKQPKRFRLRCGTVVKVDEEDAHFLRTVVWRAHKTTKGEIEVVSGHGNEYRLSHQVLPGHEVVMFKNGDRTDFRRENLQGMTKKEFWQRCGKHLRAGRMLKQIADVVTALEKA